MLEIDYGRYNITGKEDLKRLLSEKIPTCDSSQVVNLIYKRLGKNNPTSVIFYGDGGLEIILHGYVGYKSLLYGKFVLKRSGKGLILVDKLKREILRIREISK